MIETMKVLDTPYLFRLLTLILCVIRCGAQTTTSPVQTWTCTGPYSSLAYRDCEGTYYNTSGCYFLEHFAQYRACAGICNNVMVNSFKEEKCAAYCSDYLKSCQISSLTTETMAIKNHYYASSSYPTHTTQHQRYISALNLSVALGCVAVAAAGIIVSVIVWRRHKQKRSHKEETLSNGSLLLKIPVTDRGIQDSDEAKAEGDSDDGYSVMVSYASDCK